MLLVVLEAFGCWIGIRVFANASIKRVLET